MAAHVADEIRLDAPFHETPVPLVDRVRANGGTARVLRIAFDDANEEARVVSFADRVRVDFSKARLSCPEPS